MHHMAGMKMPNYEGACARENGLKILQALAKKGGVAKFSEIEEASGVRGNVLTHHLGKLWSLGVIEKEVKGTYRLTYKTPLCYIFPAEVPFAYFGLLGRKEARAEPETKVALQLLEKEGIRPELVYVVTSPEALNEWKDLRLPYQWILCYEEEVIDIDTVKQKVIPQLVSLLREYIVMMDCTALTKPATIAYYELASTYHAPLIYVYDHNGKRQLKWLISKETIKQKFGISPSA